MDTTERIAAARARLGELQLDERRADKAGQPCTKCIHYVPETQGGFNRHRTPPFCGHLVYTDRRFDPTTGRFIENKAVTAAVARSEDGLCGPEAILFDDQGKMTLGRKLELAFVGGNALLFLYYFGPAIFH